MGLVYGRDEKIFNYVNENSYNKAFTTTLKLTLYVIEMKIIYFLLLMICLHLV